jgi:hypothetical protein
MADHHLLLARNQAKEKTMTRFILGLFVCMFFSLSVASSSNATLINKYFGEDQSDRVVYDDMNDLYWYPILTDFTGMSRADQEAAIAALSYAGTDNWRMATATETTVQKYSLAEMATAAIPTSWADYGNHSEENRTLSSPNLAFDVFPADFFTPTGYTEGEFWSGGTNAYMFNGRTTGWGWTNTGSGGFGGQLEFLFAAADDHFVAHSYMSEIPFSTITFNYDLHLRGDEEITMGMGDIGAWVVTNSINPVPEPATILLLGGGLAFLAFYRKKK